MFKVSAFVICLLVSSAFCQTASKYQVATIMDVKTHQAAGSSAVRKGQLRRVVEAASHEVGLIHEA